MKFFIPGVPDHGVEAAYQALYDTAKAQLRTPITPRRIFRLEYVHDKRNRHLAVGEAHPEHHRYQILAILESKPYIVMTRDLSGEIGPTFMVNGTEITDVTEFENNELAGKA